MKYTKKLSSGAKNQHKQQRPLPEVAPIDTEKIKETQHQSLPVLTKSTKKRIPPVKRKRKKIPQARKHSASFPTYDL